MDFIFITELRLETRIGIYDWEKQVSQPILLDLEVGLPGGHASASDHIGDTIDYSRIVERVRQLFLDHHFSLLEHAAASIADMVQRDFGAPWIRVSIAKIAPLKGVKRLGITIERGAKQ